MSEAKVFIAPKNVRNVTANQNKKTVYKSVVSSPFMLKWPSVHTDLGQTILSQLIKTLEPLGEYRNKKISTEPELKKRIYIGINQVTRRLESYTKTLPTDKIPVIFICKREIKPLQLCQHLLSMAALTKVRLVPMPAASETKISQALHLNRSSVVLLELVENKEEALCQSTRDIPFIQAPWLSNALLCQDPIQYSTKDTLKTLKTTMSFKGVKRKSPEDPSKQTLKKNKIV